MDIKESAKYWLEVLDPNLSTIEISEYCIKVNLKKWNNPTGRVHIHTDSLMNAILKLSKAVLEGDK